jgi:hypothetical protein
VEEDLFGTIFDWQPVSPSTPGVPGQSAGQWDLITGLGGSSQFFDWRGSPGVRRNSPSNPINLASLWDLIIGLGGHTQLFEWWPSRRAGGRLPAFTVAGQIRALFEGGASLAAFTVAGELLGSFLGTTAPIAFWVKGKLAASFTGTNEGYASATFTVPGILTASFTQGQQASFTVAGQIQASFFGLQGQTSGNITGSQLETSTPNYVH